MGELWALPTMLRIGIVKSLTQTLAQAMGIKTESEQASGVEISTEHLTDESNIANYILSLARIGNSRLENIL